MLNAKIKRNYLRNLTLIIGLSVGLFFVYQSIDLSADVDSQYNDREDFMEGNLTDAQQRLGNVNYSNAFVTPFILTGAFFTPFPSFLYSESRQFGIIAHYQNEIVKNIMYYFGILGMIIILKKNFRKTILLTFFVLSYLFVLMTTANSFLDRFQLPNVPFIIIFMSVGLIDSDIKWKKGWNYYLILLFIVHATWTLFKLNIRGI